MTYSQAINILLVEDNPHDAELTLLALKTQNLANNFYIVNDGAEALDFLFAQGPYIDRLHSALPQVILLDLKLPKIGGLEVLQAIKANEVTKSIPVVIVTSSAEYPDLRAAYQLGANSYVVKPVGFEAFQEAMSRLGFYWLLINHPSQ
jgi:two-component system response regulator